MAKDTVSASSPSAGYKTRWRSLRRLVRVLAIIAVSLAVLMMLGLWAARNPGQALALGEFFRDNFWAIAALRWSLYLALILAWPWLSAWLAKVATPCRPEQRGDAWQALMTWRWPLARILVVYELLFPLNLIGWMGGRL